MSQKTQSKYIPRPSFLSNCRTAALKARSQTYLLISNFYSKSRHRCCVKLTFLSVIFCLLCEDFFFLSGCGVDLFLVTGLDFFFLTNGTFSSESSSSLSSLWYEKKSIHLRNIYTKMDTRKPK